MRKHLFATDEILIPVDAMNLQDNAGLDTSSLLAAMAGLADANVTSGIEPMAVLAGLTVTAAPYVSGVTVTVEPGTIIYKVADDDNVTWKLATLRQSVTLTMPYSQGPVPGPEQHRSVFVEAVITETVTNENREFRRELAGRVIIQTESTPKIKQAVLTLRLRSGVEVALASNPYLPPWDATALPLARIYVGAAAATATDIRKVYRSYCGGNVLHHPLRAQTDASLFPSTTIEKNYLGFGNLSSIDYCEVSAWSNTYPAPTGITFPLAAGYIPVANTVGYVYGYRVHPKVGAMEYVVSPVAPDVDRNLPVGSFTAPSPWPLGTVSTGTEVKYLFAQPWYDFSVPCPKEVSGDVYTMFAQTLFKKFVGVTNANDEVFDVADIMPAFTSSASFRILVEFTDPVPDPTRLAVRMGRFSLPLADAIRFPTTTTPTPVLVVELPSLNVQMQRNLGMKFQMYFDFDGADVVNFDVTVIPTIIRESYRQ